MESVLQKLSSRDSLNLERKTFHILIGLLIYSPYLILGNIFPYTQWFLFLLVFSILSEYLRLKIPYINNLFLENFSILFRKSEATNFSAVIPFIFCMLLTTYLFPRGICHMAVACQLLADPFASIIGINFGKKVIWDSRTLEGSLGCFGIGFLISFFGLIYLFHFSFVQSFILAFAGGIVCSLAELIPIPFIDDNFRVGFFTGSFYYLVLHFFLRSI